MHYVSNVKAEDPVVCSVAFDTERAASLDFVFLFHFELVHFFKSLEGDLQLFLFGHAILKVVSPLLKRELRYFDEFALDFCQLLHNHVGLLHLLGKYLYLFRDIVGAATVRRH